MTQNEQEIQRSCIAAFIWLQEMLERCEDCRTEYKLSDVQVSFNDLYNDWLARVEPAEDITP
ncbi:MAG: hypothetical protein IKG61_01290 [Selenomonadaceae bacterium]|nr:hypothetical protein [Selenomonadaceae bacterium]